MSRGMDRQDDRPVVQSSTGGAKSTVSAGSTIRDRDSGRNGERTTDRSDTRRPPSQPLPSGARRERVLHDRHTYTLRGTESRVLDTLATFRVVLERDLVDDVYAGHRARMGKELSSLESQGLVARRELAADRSGHHVRISDPDPRGSGPRAMGVTRPCACAAFEQGAKPPSFGGSRTIAKARYESNCKGPGERTPESALRYTSWQGTAKKTGRNNRRSERPDDSCPFLHLAQTHSPSPASVRRRVRFHPSARLDENTAPCL